MQGRSGKVTSSRTYGVGPDSNVTHCGPDAGHPHRQSGRMPALVNRLQFLARLEADGLARRNRNFGAGPRISSDAGLARAHVEHAETAQFNAVAIGERLLHALEDGFDGELRLGLGDPGAIDDFVDDVELNHGYPPSPKDLVCLKLLMLREIGRIVNRGVLQN